MMVLNTFGLLERVGHDHGDGCRDEPRGLDAHHGLGRVHHGFHQDRVGAALEQGFDLLLEDHAEVVRHHVAQRVEEVAEGADVAEHPGVVARGGAREFRGGDVEFASARGLAVATEHRGRAAEGVGGDQVASAQPVRVVDRLHIAGSVDVPEHAALPAGHAAGHQLGSHRPVAAEGLGGEGVEQRLAHDGLRGGLRGMMPHLPLRCHTIVSPGHGVGGNPRPDGSLPSSRGNDMETE
jgi:hypothetical protein